MSARLNATPGNHTQVLTANSYPTTVPQPSMQHNSSTTIPVAQPDQTANTALSSSASPHSVPSPSNLLRIAVPSTSETVLNPNLSAVANPNVKSPTPTPASTASVPDEAPLTRVQRLFRFDREISRRKKNLQKKSEGSQEQGKSEDKSPITGTTSASPQLMNDSQSGHGTASSVASPAQHSASAAAKVFSSTDANVQQNQSAYSKPSSAVVPSRSNAVVNSTEGIHKEEAGLSGLEHTHAAPEGTASDLIRASPGTVGAAVTKNTVPAREPFQKETPERSISPSLTRSQRLEVPTSSTGSASKTVAAFSPQVISPQVPEGVGDEDATALGMLRHADGMTFSTGTNPQSVPSTSSGDNQTPPRPSQDNTGASQPQTSGIDDPMGLNVLPSGNAEPHPIPDPSVHNNECATRLSDSTKGPVLAMHASSLPEKTRDIVLSSTATAHDPTSFGEHVNRDALTPQAPEQAETPSKTSSDKDAEDAPHTIVPQNASGSVGNVSISHISDTQQKGIAAVAQQVLQSYGNVDQPDRLERIVQKFSSHLGDVFANGSTEELQKVLRGRGRLSIDRTHTDTNVADGDNEHLASNGSSFAPLGPLSVLSNPPSAPSDQPRADHPTKTADESAPSSRKRTRSPSLEPDAPERPPNRRRLEGNSSREGSPTHNGAEMVRSVGGGGPSGAMEGQVYSGGLDAAQEPSVNDVEASSVVLHGGPNESLTDAMERQVQTRGKDTVQEPSVHSVEASSTVLLEELKPACQSESSNNMEEQVQTGGLDTTNQLSVDSMEASPVVLHEDPDSARQKEPPIVAVVEQHPFEALNTTPLSSVKDVEASSAVSHDQSNSARQKTRDKLPIDDMEGQVQSGGLDATQGLRVKGVNASAATPHDEPNTTQIGSMSPECVTSCKPGEIEYSGDMGASPTSNIPGVAHEPDPQPIEGSCASVGPATATPFADEPVHRSIRALDLPILKPHDYHPSHPYEIISIVEGSSEAGTQDVQFELDDGQAALVKRWANRDGSFKKSDPCICLTLTCIQLTDGQVFSENNEEASKNEALRNIPIQWPKNGGFHITVEGDDVLPISLGISPPDWVKSHEPMDLSSVIGSRTTKIRFVQTQDYSQYVFMLRAHRPTEAQLCELAQSFVKGQAWVDMFARFTAPLKHELRTGIFSSPSPSAS
ncbi:hypothetical protein K439DRAFT_1063352 [Ramaria rubella]|nr:hypothetical protein K439DRAFT_1063352 [Ramaria rubella]